MSADDFWYDDAEMFTVYVKAYTKKANYTAWLQGFYNMKAFETVIHNKIPYAINIALGGSNGKYEAIHYFNEPIDLLENDNKVEEVIVGTVDEEVKYNSMLNSFA